MQTVQEDVELILELAQVTSKDYLIDLGSGDGRFVIAASKRGAMAVGVELNPELVTLSMENAKRAEVADRVAFIHGDIFEADIANATVVVLYLFPEANIQLQPKLLAELKPGTRVVSNSFHMGEWEPDQRAQGRTSGGALLWVIPADVGGRWQLPLGDKSYHLTLSQRFQKVSALQTKENSVVPVSSLRLFGSELSFLGKIEQRTYRFNGRVEGDQIRGTATVVSDHKTQTLRWQANRRP